MSKFIRYTMFLISLPCFLSAFFWGNYSLMLISSLLIFSQNIIFCFEKIKVRILFLIFNLTFFMFLVGRPTISVFKGTEWVLFEDDQMYFSLTSIFVSFIFLFWGTVVAEKLLLKQKFFLTKKTDSYLLIQNVSLMIFYFSTIFKFIIEFEKLLFMRGKDYEQFYTLFESKLPMLVYSFSKIFLPALCVFLSTAPNKKKCLLPLFLFCASGIPMLLVGARGEFVLNALFVFVYYFLRDALNKNKLESKWIGKKERYFLMFSLPVVIILLSIYNYTRSNIQMSSNNPLFLVLDFFYKQGVSFNVLAIGYGAIPKLLATYSKAYTFGSLIDYLKYSTISRYFFEIQDLPAGNNVQRAQESNSFAHGMSYITRGDEYLSGNGWGSSYILESYADFGWIGVILANLFIAFLLVCLLKWLSKSWIFSAVSLTILSSIFFLPRTQTTEFLVLLLAPHFWITVFGVGLLYKLLIKKYYLLKGKNYNV